MRNRAPGTTPGECIRMLASIASGGGNLPLNFGPDPFGEFRPEESQTDNALVIQFNCNAWGASAPGQPAVDYTVVKELKGSQE